MNKRERPTYRFIRRGMTLRPAMEYDCAALEGVAHNEEVTVHITQGRFNPRLRAYWAMLRDCVDATGCAPSKEALHEAVKLHTGHGVPVRLSDGTELLVPGSIAFDAMSEQEFVRFFRAAEEWLAREFGFVRERIEA